MVFVPEVYAGFTHLEDGPHRYRGVMLNVALVPGSTFVVLARVALFLRPLQRRPNLLRMGNQQFPGLWVVLDYMIRPVRVVLKFLSHASWTVSYAQAAVTDKPMRLS